MRTTLSFVLLASALTACDGALDGAAAPTTCAEACAPCGDGSQCEPVCTSLVDALEPLQSAAWRACFAADACDPEQARRCMDGLGCHDEALIAAHCDVLARCANDGRGQLNEAECRDQPYHEPSRWGCLRPDRRAQVQACLVGETCDTLGPCLDNAVCAGDGMCGSLLATSLTVDCHRVCSNHNYACVFPDAGGDYGACWRACDDAARTLADVFRRRFEDCATQEDVCPAGGLLRVCLRALECDPGLFGGPVQRYVERCGAPAHAWPLTDWSCLGHVIMARMMNCFNEAACADIDACLAAAAGCGDDAHCLDYLDLRRD